MATKRLSLPNRVTKQHKIHEAAKTKTVTKGNPAKSVSVPSHGSGK